VESDVFSGSSVGVILPENISEVERQHFELLLQSLTNLLHRQVSELLLGHCFFVVSESFLLLIYLLLSIRLCH